MDIQVPPVTNQLMTFRFPYRTSGVKKPEERRFFCRHGSSVGPGYVIMKHIIMKRNISCILSSLCADLRERKIAQLSSRQSLRH